MKLHRNKVPFERNVPLTYVEGKGRSMMTRFRRMLHVHRNHKDRLFRFIFNDKEALLSLYNAMSGTHYDRPDELEINTLDDVIYLNMKNDLSFLIRSVVSLYEHQSSWNPNIPLRGFLYFGRVYQAYIEKMKYDIYGKKLVHLPFPQFIVFYNGEGMDGEERRELLLSEAFEPLEKSTVPCLECRAVIVNINLGYNGKLMEECRKLYEYASFVDKVRHYTDTDSPLAAAVDHAVDDCIRDGILSDILIKHRAEVKGLLLTEYDEKKHIKLIRRDAREEGRIEGQTKGRSLGRSEGQMLKLISQVMKKRLTGQNVSQIAEDLIEDQKLIQQIFQIILQHPDEDADSILERFTDAQTNEFM